MKKILLTASFLTLFAGASFAQSKAVKAAEREAKQENPNFTEAQKQISGALQNDETKNEAGTWYVAGFVDYRVFEIERNKLYINKKPDEPKMYNALYTSLGYYKQAAELDLQPDKKGKVKPRYLKKIKKNIADMRDNLINGGAYFFDNGDYQKAYDYFNLFIEVPTYDFLAEKDPKDAAIQVVDSIDAQIKEYATLSLNKVYQTKVADYQAKKDTANIIKTLEEGAELFKTEIYYVQNLINMYIYADRFDEATSYLDKAITSDSENAKIYWNVKGTLLENKEDEEGAISCYQQAIELDPTYVDGLENMGRMYYNQAVMANDEVSKILDEKEYNTQREAKVLAKYREALPYFEKAHELLPTERRLMVTLNNIYYNLNDGEKMKEMEKKMAQ